MGIKKDVAQELFDKLHPEFDKLKPGEQMRLMEEEDVISDNLEEILEYCSKYKKTILKMEM